jgi:cytochrome c553
MKKTFTVATALALILGGSVVKAQQPAWAYAINPPRPADAPAPTPAPPDPTPKRLSGSTAEFTRAQITNMFAAADWYPGDHPPMPDVVAKGRAPDVRRCSFCHYANGKGRPENAGIAGLPVAYFIQQLNDFRNGDRQSSEPRKANTPTMIGIAKGMTNDEMRQAAEYFGSMKWTPWMKVVETATVPKTRLQGMFMTLPGNEKEPIGKRIIETPVDGDATQLFDSRSSFIVYVPVGSIKKGEELATKGMGKTTQCALCHGADLRGLGPVPGLAGRSPSYLGRQLYDMQQGARHGVWTDLMKPVVANLNEEDILNIAAYTASLAP